MPQNVNIIFLEDDIQEWELLEMHLAEYNIALDHVKFYATAISMLAALPTSPGSVIVIDYQLKHDIITGDKVIKDAKAICEDNYFIMVTGEADKSAVVSFMKNKADDFFEKGEPNYYGKLVEGIILGRQEVKKRNDKTQKLKESEEWLIERVHRLNKMIAEIKPGENDKRADY